MSDDNIIDKNTALEHIRILSELPVQMANMLGNQDKMLKLLESTSDKVGDLELRCNTNTLNIKSNTENIESLSITSANNSKKIDKMITSRNVFISIVIALSGCVGFLAEWIYRILHK